jgi:hypothetical protein
MEEYVYRAHVFGLVGEAVFNGLVQGPRHGRCRKACPTVLKPSPCFYPDRGCWRHGAPGDAQVLQKSARTILAGDFILRMHQITV